MIIVIMNSDAVLVILLSRHSTRRFAGLRRQVAISLQVLYLEISRRQIEPLPGPQISHPF